MEKTYGAFYVISEGVPEIKLAKVKMKMEQENMPEIIIGSDDFSPFNYSDENGSQVDLTAYGRSDEKGIIITFYHTSAEYSWYSFHSLFLLI